MKLDGALKGGIAGATTLALLTETLGRVNGNSSHFNVLQNGKLKKRLKKTGSKNTFRATKEYIKLAEDILGSAAYLGIHSLSKKKNTMLRGGILGTATGFGNVFLKREEQKKESVKNIALVDEHSRDINLSTKLLKVSLYTIGGLIAGKIVEDLHKKKRRKK